MRFKDCAIGYVKSIYRIKIEATEKNDKEKLASLQRNYPEIFDGKFLIDFLKNEITRARQELDDSMLFKTELFKYH